MNIRERDDRLRNVLGIRNQAADANVNAAVETEDSFDTTAFTADRQWILPGGAYIGERCSLVIEDDASGFAVAIRCAVGSTINGVDHSGTDFDSLDTVGQSAHFVCIADDAGVGTNPKWVTDFAGAAAAPSGSGAVLQVTSGGGVITYVDDGAGAPSFSSAAGTGTLVPNGNTILSLRWEEDTDGSGVMELTHNLAQDAQFTAFRVSTGNRDGAANSQSNTPFNVLTMNGMSISVAYRFVVHF